MLLTLLDSSPLKNLAESKVNWLWKRLAEYSLDPLREELSVDCRILVGGHDSAFRNALVQFRKQELDGETLVALLAGNEEEDVKRTFETLGNYFDGQMSTRGWSLISKFVHPELLRIRDLGSVEVFPHLLLQPACLAADRVGLTLAESLTGTRIKASDFVVRAESSSSGPLWARPHVISTQLELELAGLDKKLDQPLKKSAAQGMSCKLSEVRVLFAIVSPIVAVGLRPANDVQPAPGDGPMELKLKHCVREGWEHCKIAYYDSSMHEWRLARSKRLEDWHPQDAAARSRVEDGEFDAEAGWVEVKGVAGASAWVVVVATCVAEPLMLNAFIRPTMKIFVHAFALSDSKIRFVFGMRGAELSERLVALRPAVGWVPLSIGGHSMLELCVYCDSARIALSCSGGDTYCVWRQDDVPSLDVDVDFAVANFAVTFVTSPPDGKPLKGAAVAAEPHANPTSTPSCSRRLRPTRPAARTRSRVQTASSSRVRRLQLSSRRLRPTRPAARTRSRAQTASNSRVRWQLRVTRWEYGS
ncbi:hypothetical protein T492DRAFT_347465 [Pavlovales sp. CCMP2436]|nr:hypothetical protein T492DRAFT_347465 [Pavlovales sp. CCMP2436]